MKTEPIELTKEVCVSTNTPFEIALDNALVMHNMIDEMRSEICAAYDIQISALVGVLNDTLSFALHDHEEWLYSDAEEFKELKSRALKALL